MTSKDKLNANINAIEVALKLNGGSATAEEMQILKQYGGFGDLKCILLNPENPNEFSASEQHLIPSVQRLHNVINENDKGRYNEYINSLKESVLTSFYTPNEVVASINNAFERNRLTFQNVLDPSAGLGAFTSIKGDNYTLIEKDLLTNQILAALNPEKKTILSGFENTSANLKNSFNLVTSNIPFGNFKVFDSEYYNSNNPILRQSTNAIHTYFFEKGIDMLRDGGILAFITSTGFMDSQNNEIFRKHILTRSRFISAVRLPENTFDGTKAQSDLIILQKDNRRTENSLLSYNEENFIRVSELNDNQVYINSFYLDNNSNYIATDRRIDTDMYGKLDLRLIHSGGVTGIARDLQRVVTLNIRNNIDKKLFDAYNIQKQVDISKPLQLNLFEDFFNPVNQVNEVKTTFEYTNSIYNHEGSFQLNGNTIGVALTDKIAEILNQDDINIRQLIIDYVGLRDSYYDLKNFENSHLRESPEKRTELNRRYDAFTNSPYSEVIGNPITIRNSYMYLSCEPSYMELKGIERIVDDKIVKADVFYEPVAFGREKSNLTAQEAMHVSRNRLNRVDLDYIHSLTGLNQNEILKQLKGFIYKNPETMQYESADMFLSGNVVEKYKNSLHIGLKNLNDTELIEATKALKEVIPAHVPFNEIGLNFGERWIPTSYYNAFISYLFNDLDSRVYYNPFIDDFDISGLPSYYANQRFAVKSENRYYSANDVVRFALIDSIPQMTKTVGSGKNKKTVPDAKGIQLMNTNIAVIKNEWDTWLSTLPEQEKQQLQSMYNERFNCFVKPQFDGSFQTFPGLDLSKVAYNDLYQSQKDAILRIKCQNGGIIDHEVGGGKTMIMCCAAYELKRLGIANKPLIVGIKANTNEISETFKKVYPNAKILYADAKNFNKEKRDVFFNSIQNNNWDCIIMTHEQFMNIPQSDDVERKVIVEELTKVERSLASLYDSDISFKRAKKALEQRKKTLTVKLYALNETLNKKRDNVIDFRTMGIDHIFCDESHRFKNLRVQTRHERVAGIGNTQGSNRSMNMKYAIRDIQERKGSDLCATFVSGTTIVNSCTELYVLFDYLRPRALEKQSIECFDAWASIYTKKSQEIEFSVTNELIMKERFREFVKVPELSLFYGEITDYKTAKDIGIDRPNKNEILVTLQPTEAQTDMFSRLKEFANTGDGNVIFRPKLNSDEVTAKMLIATNTAKKTSIDMRLIDNERYGSDASNRTEEVAERAFTYYQKYNEQKGTQFIFSDIGVHNSDDKFSVYNDIKQKLIQMGVPEHEIKFIQDFKTDKKRDALFTDVNNGKVRILLGSTEMLGTGVNAQERCVAIHHVDIPWTPKDFEQRNGRGVRKGNRVAKFFCNNSVDIFTYATKGSLDTYKFNIVANKAHFIHQIKSGSAHVRSLDEGGMDSNTGMSYGEYIAILSGNTDLLEKAKVEKEISILKSEKRIIMAKVSERDINIEKFQAEINKNNTHIECFKKDFEEFKKIQFDKDDLPLTSMIIDNKEYRDLKSFGDAINSVLDRPNKDTVNLQTIGSFGNFKLVMRAQESHVLSETVYQNVMFVQGTLNYQFNRGVVARTSEVAGRYPIRALRRIENELIPQFNQRNQTVTRQINDLKSISFSFHLNDKLVAAEARLSELNKKISDEIIGGTDKIVEMSFNKGVQRSL